ncbi:hypothetical protein [Methanobacterium sp.]|uniref:hypothetical protein n=1 Tax=Methanobacterium sp. TaxID=2164 RepID=UPI003C72AEA3
MIDKAAWFIKCDNCQKEYDIPKDAPVRLEQVYGEERLVLEFRPECPSCNMQNSRIANKISNLDSPRS